MSPEKESNIDLQEPQLENEDMVLRESLVMLLMDAKSTEECKKALKLSARWQALFPEDTVVKRASEQPAMRMSAGKESKARESGKQDVAKALLEALDQRQPVSTKHLGPKDSREGGHDQSSHAPSKARLDRFASRGFVKASVEDRKRLKIPPAWKDVQVDRSKDAPLLAVGTDAKGREQRIYSAKHHEKQAAAKFARIRALHDRMPDIDDQLAQDAPDNDTAMAALLIRRMGLRPGSDSDTGSEKQAYGATTLKTSHVGVKKDKVSLNFVGKKGVDLSLEIEDSELAAHLNDRMKNRGKDDRLLDTNATKLRQYLSGISPGLKPKDFRTYLGTSVAKELVDSMDPPASEKDYQTKRRQIANRVSSILGNTPTVALESYIAPSVFGPWDVQRKAS